MAKKLTLSEPDNTIPVPSSFSLFRVPNRVKRLINENLKDFKPMLTVDIKTGAILFDNRKEKYWIFE